MLARVTVAPQTRAWFDSQSSLVTLNEIQVGTTLTHLVALLASIHRYMYITVHVQGTLSVEYAWNEGKFTSLIHLHVPLIANHAIIMVCSAAKNLKSSGRNFVVEFLGPCTQTTDACVKSVITGFHTHGTRTSIHAPRNLFTEKNTTHFPIAVGAYSVRFHLVRVIW